MADFESRNVIRPSKEKVEELSARLAEKPDLKGPGSSEVKSRSEDFRATPERKPREDLPRDDVETKKEVATTALQGLSAKDQAEVASQIQGPTQQVTNLIWQIIVGTFAAVVSLFGIGLLYVAILPPLSGSDSTQVLLPVFTSIAGILAGFILGRASKRGTTRS
jgi:hypothetical protein